MVAIHISRSFKKSNRPILGYDYIKPYIYLLRELYIKKKIYAISCSIIT